MVLQWHITNRCNQRCKHCYQEDYSGKELEFKEWLMIIKQFSELCDMIRNADMPHWEPHINVTGGEPFVHKDFMKLLEVLSSQKSWMSFGIMANGSLIDEEVAKELARLGPTAVQVSIEGTEETHNDIRGDGNLEKVVSAIKIMRKHGVCVHVSFTAHAENYKEFIDVVELSASLGVNKVWSDRMIPCGSGKELEHLVMTPEQTLDYISIMHEARTMLTKKGFTHTQVGLERALQFLVGGGRPYSCGAGTRVLIVMPDGDILICRRMPISLGNVKDIHLSTAYFENDLVLKLRNRNSIPDKCKGCRFQRTCRGGLKCLAYEMFGDPFAGDPGCWVAAAEEAKGVEDDRDSEGNKPSNNCKYPPINTTVCKTNCGTECRS